MDTKRNEVISLIWRAIDNALDDGSISCEEIAKIFGAPMPEDRASARIIFNAFNDYVVENFLH